MQRPGCLSTTTQLSKKMQIRTPFVLAAVAIGAQAATTLTGQYSCATSGNYQLCNDQWGSGECFPLPPASPSTHATTGNGDGSQTSTLESTSGDSITWSTTYTWSENENDVKSCKWISSRTHTVDLTLFFQTPMSSRHLVPAA